MPVVKINENQILGKQELNRIVEFLGDKGYRKVFQSGVKQWGFVVLKTDLTFDNLKAVAGSTPAKVSINSGWCIDNNCRSFGTNSNIIDALTVPTDSVVRYIKVRNATNPKEVGTLNISTTGVMTGIGTLFTKVLRGATQQAVKIKFLNSTSNTSEYEVLSVTSDTNARLNYPAFTAEVNLTYKVIGSFDSGVVVPSLSKDIYQHDYIEVFLDATSTISGGDIDNTFLVASVATDGVVMTLVDKRQQTFNLGTTRLIPAVATYNTLLQKIEFSDLSTDFYTLSLTSPALFLHYDVLDMTTAGRDRRITIYCSGRLRFNCTTYFSTLSRDTLDSFYKTEINGCIEFIEVSGIVSTVKFIIVAGGEVRQSGVNKVFGRFMQNKATSTFIVGQAPSPPEVGSGTAPAESLLLTNQGNFQNIAKDSGIIGPQNLKYIQSRDLSGNLILFPSPAWKNGEYGTRMTLLYTGATGDLVIKHNTAVAPSVGFKKIFTAATGGDVTPDQNSIIEIIEDESYWRIVSIR